VIPDASGNVGIGKSSPPSLLSVNGSLYVYGNGQFGGSIYQSTSNLGLNATLGSFALGTSSRHIQLQYSSIPLALTGNVGIGLASPSVRLHVGGGTDVNGNNGGFLQLGNSNSTNIGFDDNEIQARNNGVAAKLNLQNNGGDLHIGGSTYNVIVNDGNQLYRTRPFSQHADLLPVAYAKITMSDGVVSGTGNVIYEMLEYGEFRLQLLGVSDLYENRDQYTIIVSAGSLGHHIINYNIVDDDSIRIFIRKYWVYFDNDWCLGAKVCPEISSSIINPDFYQDSYATFCVMVYKQ
jgi:hypothetical protein